MQFQRRRVDLIYETAQCVIRFEKPASSLVSVLLAHHRQRRSDIWQDNTWKTIRSGRVMGAVWMGARGTDRIRIRPTAAWAGRRLYGSPSWALR